jgi:hypothetical protein
MTFRLYIKLQNYWNVANFQKLHFFHIVFHSFAKLIIFLLLHIIILNCSFQNSAVGKSNTIIINTKT